MVLNFRRFDAYPKTAQEFQKRTFGGAASEPLFALTPSAEVIGAVSITSGLFILFLIISEFSLYRTVQSVDKVLRSVPRRWITLCAALRGPLD